MDKVLKLSKKIANAGFEPDMWTNEDDGGNLILDFLNWHEEQSPIFSADWCWKMLPNEIKKMDNSIIWGIDIERTYSLNAFNDSVGYDEILNGEFEGDLITSLINDSLHEALLELVCWCIDNGYLKVQEDNARV